MVRIVVNQRKCIGCGTCTFVAPKTFKIGKNGKAEVIDQASGLLKEVKEAIDSCPVGAISRRNN